MSAIAVPMLVCAMLGIFGDVMCKFAVSQDGGKRLAYTLVAGFAWSLTSFAWVAAYRSKSILEMVVLYTPLYSVFVGIVGVLVFGDTFTPKLAIGAILSALAVWAIQ